MWQTESRRPLYHCANAAEREITVLGRRPNHVTAAAASERRRHPA